MVAAVEEANQLEKELLLAPSVDKLSASALARLDEAALAALDGEDLRHGVTPKLLALLS